MDCEGSGELSPEQPERAIIEAIRKNASLVLERAMGFSTASQIGVKMFLVSYHFRTLGEERLGAARFKSV